MKPAWKLLNSLEDRRDGSFLLHGPGLVHPDFNPEGVERGYWQDGATPGSVSTGGQPYSESTGHSVPDNGPGAWCVPGWDSNGDVFTTRYLADGEEGITHFIRVPEGPFSQKR